MLLKILALPMVIVSWVIFFFPIKKLHEDLRKCIDIVDRYGDDFPFLYIELLVFGEDHRFWNHPGVDSYSILRVIYIFFLFKKKQGASTIEQQFVRVVSGEYKKTVFRKLREQVLAIKLSSLRRKKNIASAYLSIAYYGHNKIGISAIKILLGDDFLKHSYEDVSKVIARLKYPEPSDSNDIWMSRIVRRSKYILNRKNDGF